MGAASIKQMKNELRLVIEGGYYSRAASNNGNTVYTVVEKNHGDD